MEKKLERVLFLAADTARSQAYAQAMECAGFRLGNTVVITTESGEPRWGKSHTLPPQPDENLFPNLFVPDFAVPLRESCERLSDRVVPLAEGTVNSEKVRSVIDECQPELIIYSGFGGELVRNVILNHPAPLLHMHSGWLPNYRGSTTMYYSLLQDGVCSVTAIILEQDIDAGPMVARESYPPPPSEVDLDYYYDGMIRANTLLNVLEEFSRKGVLPEIPACDKNKSDMYYIIHPLLKNIAMLKLKSADRKVV